MGRVEHKFPVITIGPLDFNLVAMMTTVIAGAIVFLIGRLAVRNLDVRQPRGWQNLLEWLIEFVRGLARTSMPEKVAERYVTLALTLFMYIFVSNQLGLLFNVQTTFATDVPFLGIKAGDHVSWWASPTANVSVTTALATMVFVYSHYVGIRGNPKTYVKHYFEPNFLFFPVNLIEELTKLLTLGMRLFGNIFAGEVLIALLVVIGLYGTVPLVAWLGFSVFVGTIQAFIFTMLTLVYISQKVAHDHH